jgi:adenylate kinase family enzyme
VRALQRQPGASRVVILVIGPPGSGKSTMARHLAEGAGLALFDRDEPQWRDDDRAFLHAVRIACQRANARVVIVRSGTTPVARARIIRTTRPTRILAMNTSEEECLRRIKERQRGDLAWQAHGIAKWFATPPTADERTVWEAHSWNT